MYTAQISLKKQPLPSLNRTTELTDTEHQKDYESKDADELFGLIASLRKHGQIMHGTYPIIEKEGKLVAFVNIAEEDSLASKYHNSHTQKELLKLATRVEFLVLGKDPLYADTCQCKNNQQREFLILHTDFLSRESPVDCGKCKLPIPLYKLPKTHEDNDEYLDIIRWKKDFQALDNLQMHGTIEKFALKQLGDISSEFNINSRKLVQALAKTCGIPVYYYLYQYYGESLEDENNRKCPNCGNDWKLDHPYRHFDFKCDRCHLLSNIAYDLRQL